jgi:hypothetical protein
MNTISLSDGSSRHNTSTGDEQALYSYPFPMEDDYKDFKVMEKKNPIVIHLHLISLSGLAEFTCG